MGLESHFACITAYSDITRPGGGNFRVGDIHVSHLSRERHKIFRARSGERNSINTYADGTESPK